MLIRPPLTEGLLFYPHYRRDIHSGGRVCIDEGITIFPGDQPWSPDQYKGLSTWMLEQKLIMGTLLRMSL